MSSNITGRKRAKGEGAVEEEPLSLHSQIYLVGLKNRNIIKKSEIDIINNKWYKLAYVSP